MLNKAKSEKLKAKNFLREIVKIKEEEILKLQKTQKTRVPVDQHIRKSDSSSFLKIFKKKGNHKVVLIAEIKFASPTSPNLGATEDLLNRAKEYEDAGSDAISLITEEHFFKGSISFITKVKNTVLLPVLQKDFVIDESQIYEAQKAGSDALLLIAGLVETKRLQEFVSVCFSLGIEPIVEINDEEDLEKAVATETNIIAVNARDLKTFEIDVRKACLLMQKIPDRFAKLGFSGIRSQEEIVQYRNSGAAGILIGTSLMKVKDIKQFISDLQL